MNNRIPNYNFDGDFFAPNSEVSRREQANIVQTLNGLSPSIRKMIYLVIRDQRIMAKNEPKSE